MPINPHTNLLEQWSQKQFMLDQLQAIANLPIDSSSRQRDTIEKQLFDFVFQKTFDSLFGGLIVNSNEAQLNSFQQKYYKPVITNIYLAETLIAADQVLYHGTFSFIGKQIVEYLISQVTGRKNKLIETHQFTALKNSDCFFCHSTLKGLLDHKELQLLLALTSSSNSKIIDSEGILLSYARPLIEAATNIEMHYKEAQIIEYNLLNKLKTSKSQREFISNPMESCFDINCELLVLLSHPLINNSVPSKTMLAVEMFYELSRRLDNESTNRNHIVNLAYAGIMLLQAEFDLDLVATIDKLTQQLSKQLKNKAPDDKTKLREQIIGLFQQRNKTCSKTSKIHLFFLSKQQVDLDTRLMELKAKFNPYQLVFIV